MPPARARCSILAAQGWAAPQGDSLKEARESEGKRGALSLRQNTMPKQVLRRNMRQSLVAFWLLSG